jgi:hypothetical protein
MPRKSTKAGATKTITKRKQKKKDPNMPKRPLTAYFLFCAAHRDEVKQKNPDAKFGEIGKFLSEEWKSAGEAEKTKFEQQAQQEKEKYKKLKEEYDRKQKTGKTSTKKKEEEEEEEEEDESESEGSDS